MTIKPLSDRIVLKPTKAEEKTKTGIILTASPNVTNPNCFVNRNWFGFVFAFNF